MSCPRILSRLAMAMSIAAIITFRVRVRVRIKVRVRVSTSMTPGLLGSLDSPSSAFQAVTIPPVNMPRIRVRIRPKLMLMARAGVSVRRREDALK